MAGRGDKAVVTGNRIGNVGSLGAAYAVVDVRAGVEHMEGRGSLGGSKGSGTSKGVGNAGPLRAAHAAG